MGCFDTVIFACPACSRAIDLQSKGGDCCLQTFHYGRDKIPAQVIADVVDDDGTPQIVKCECGRDIDIRVTVSVALVVVGDNPGPATRQVTAASPLAARLRDLTLTLKRHSALSLLAAPALVADGHGHVVADIRAIFAAVEELERLCVATEFPVPAPVSRALLGRDAAGDVVRDQTEAPK